MKKIIAIILTFTLMISLCGCQTNEDIKNSESTNLQNKNLASKEQDNLENDISIDKNRKMYSKIDLNEYVELDDYKGITIDTKSNDFLSYFDAVVSNDVYENNLYETFDKDGKGEVKNGDEVNLDYEGKIDGVVFAGGTAQGADLEIGSHTFIDDFEEELIGAKVGEIREVYVTFPENYPSADLAGKDAVFTCKINYIVRVSTLEESYEKLGFESLQAYKDDITMRAAKEYLYNAVVKNKYLLKYSKEDEALLGTVIINFLTEFYAKNGVNFEEGLAQNGMTVEQYKERATTEMLNSSMVMYYILDKENLRIKKSVLESQDSELPAELQEIYAVQDIVMEFLYDNAIIK